MHLFAVVMANEEITSLIDHPLLLDRSQGLYYETMVIANKK